MTVYYMLIVFYIDRNCAHVLSTGEGCLYHTDETTKDGLKNIFASNLFGHYTLVSYGSLLSFYRKYRFYTPPTI